MGACVVQCAGWAGCGGGVAAKVAGKCLFVKFPFDALTEWWLRVGVHEMCFMYVFHLLVHSCGAM